MTATPLCPPAPGDCEAFPLIRLVIVAAPYNRCRVSGCGWSVCRRAAGSCEGAR